MLGDKNEGKIKHKSSGKDDEVGHGPISIEKVSKATVAKKAKKNKTNSPRKLNHGKSPKKSADNVAKVIAAVTFQEGSNEIDMEVRRLAEHEISAVDPEVNRSESINNNATAIGGARRIKDRKDEQVNNSAEDEQLDYDEQGLEDLIRSNEERRKTISDGEITDSQSESESEIEDMETEETAEIPQTKGKTTINKQTGQTRIEGEEIGPVVPIVQQPFMTQETLNKLMQMHELMSSGGFFNQKKELKQTERQPQGNKLKRSRQRKTNEENNANTENAESEITIYRTAVKPKNPNINRISSSSDEIINTSDEMMDLSMGQNNENEGHEFISNIFSDYQRNRNSQEHPRPGPSGHQENQSRRSIMQNQVELNRVVNDPMNRAEQLIREAEASKARMMDISGRDNDPNRWQLNAIMHNPQRFENQDNQQGFENQGNLNQADKRILDLNNSFVHSAMVDESYSIVDSHIDGHLRQKIEDGEYVDFA